MRQLALDGEVHLHFIHRIEVVMRYLHEKVGCHKRRQEGRTDACDIGSGGGQVPDGESHEAGERGILGGDRTEVLAEHVDQEYAESSADRGLAVALGIPGETDTRRKVLLGRVPPEGHADIERGRVNPVFHNRDTVLFLGGHGPGFVAYAQIDREIGTEFPVVLEINSEDSLGEGSLRPARLYLYQMT